MAKNREPYATEMEMDRFQDWACGHILIEIGAGRSLQQAVWMVINQALANENFGKPSVTKNTELLSGKTAKKKTAKKSQIPTPDQIAAEAFLRH